MKFRMLTAAEREEIKAERLAAWHKWFAWYPIRLSADKHEIRWMETVYRRGKQRYCDGDSYYSWTYADNVMDVIRMVSDEI
jgi:hypothetical protein